MRHGRLWLILSLFAVAGWAVWSAAQVPQKPVPMQEPEEESEEDAKARTIAAAFKKALENNPRRGTALDRLYGYHVERGSLDKFVEEYAARTKKDAKDGPAWMIVGLVESQRSRDGAAVAAFQKAEEAMPENAMASYYLGQSLVLIGRPDAAAEAFERAIVRKPNRNDALDAYQALGRVYQRAQKTEKALEVWNRLEKQFPDDVRVQEQIASTLVEEGQFEQALPRLEKLAKTSDDKYRQATLRMDVADLKVKLKKSADALVDFEKMLNELNPESWLYRDVRRRIEDVFLKNDDLAGLAKYYEKWLEKNSTDVEAIARLAKNLSAQGRSTDARKWLEKGIEAAPSNKSLRQSLIDLLAFEQNYTDAAKQYEAMDKADAGNPDILRDWGKLLMRDTAKPEAERKAAAVAVWKRILEKKPNDPVTASQVADLLRTGGVPEEAIALYKKAIELAPNAPQYREYLGEYFHSLKRPKDALATWAPIAEGPNRNAKNLARLGEVFAGFGYRKEAIKVFAEAIQLEKDDYNLLMTYADVLAQESEHDEALMQLDLAGKFTSNAEEVEQVLAARVKIYQATDKLGERIDALSKEITGNANAPAEKLFVLARYFEANRQLDQAVEIIAKAHAKDGKSLAILSASARIHEAGGNMLASADANRKLANLDRRYRTEYLQQVTALEQRLGRRDDAMKTAKEVLASSPGNPEVYKWYSDICFQLGDAEEGLEALRRSVRANPSDPQGLIILASALVDRVRPGEAIELLWRAYDKTTDLEGKLGVIDRLANLNLEANQFDKLMERLERERREQEKNRELTMCIAQAFQSAGDLSSARLQLERLLTENTRDTNLLAQLSTLSEADGDVQSALKYQRQLVAAAPLTFDAQVRLAQLLLKTGEGDEAAEVWVKSVAEQNEPHRNLQAIDQLVTSNRPESALAILSRMLAKNPGNWELLYREGAILAKRGKKDDAAARFQSILAMKLPDDDLGEVLLNQVRMASKKKDDKKGTKPTAPALIRAAQNRTTDVNQPPLQRRAQAVWTIRQACGIEAREYYGGQQPQFYSPQDYGEARMAAIGWLFEFSRDKADGQEKFVAEMKKAKTAAKPVVRSLWDWYYLQTVRYDQTDTFETATALAKASDDPSAQMVFVTSVGMRTEAVQMAQRYGRNRGGAEQEDKTPPLPAEQLNYLLGVYKKLKQIKPEWVTPEVTGAVLVELKRAKRTDEEKAMYQEILNAAATVPTVKTALATAVERDDFEMFFTLFKKLEQLQGPVKSKTGLAQLPTRELSGEFTAYMGKKLEAKKYADGLRILDTYLTTVRRQNINAPKSSSTTRARRVRTGGMNFYISYGRNNGQNKQLNYPSSNDYYDDFAIQMLYTAFDFYKQADLVSDLFAHFQKQLAAAEGTEKMYLHLAVGYLHWWNEEKDEALDQLAAASQVGVSDHALTMEIAGLREQNNEFLEALTLIDSINPTDHQVMQQREETALRIAERLGNIERARQAAERLFGLRLDTDKQLDLAAKMHRLGMHELAETVLARTQRQAGNKTNILVRLMNQYQSQGQNEQAVQIARQILRKPPPVTMNTGGRYGGEENDGTRSQAMGVLARSGQLKELIERAEAQLKSSPKSIQIHQTLLGYYQAAGEKDKHKAAMIKLVELKPDDAQLKMRTAQQLQQMGDKPLAMKFYTEAIKKDPVVFQNYYYEIERLFSEEGKYEELIKLFDEIDLKKVGSYWNVMNMVTPMLEQDKTRELGMRLFKKCWESYQDERAYLLSSISNEEIWKMPELYDYTKQAVIPRQGTLLLNSWNIIGQTINYGQNGQVTSVIGRMLQTARKQHRLPELRTEIEAAIVKNPEWKAGKALLAIIDVQTGNKERGMKSWNEIFGDPKTLGDESMQARYVLAQELEYYAGIEEQIVKTLETGLDDLFRDGNMQYSYSPARRLLWWYEQVGRADDAKKLLVKLSKMERHDPGYGGGGYWQYRLIEDGLAIAGDMVRVGDPVEAVRVYQQMLSDRDSLAIASSYGGGSEQFTQQLDQGLKAALKSMKPETLPAALNQLLSPQKITETNKVVLDLMLSVDARKLQQSKLTSVFATATASLATNPEARKSALVKAKELQEKFPKDFSANIAAALVALYDDKPETAKAAIEKLAKLTEEVSLEAVPKNGKANSRQRAEAMPQVSLWLVARECLKKDDLRAIGEKLGERAVAAATRQTENKYALAILREWGQIEHDRKDTAKAEAKWAQMLDLLIPKPTPAKTAVAPAPKAVPAPAAAPAVPPQSRIDDGRPTYFAQVSTAKSASAPAPTPTTAMPTKSGIPVLTTDQFQQAYEVSLLAADKKLSALSLKAMKDALKGGPPVEGKQDENRRGGGGYQQVTVGGQQYLIQQGYQGPISVDTALIDMVGRWKKLSVPPADVYDVLVVAVFPDSRPAEMFLTADAKRGGGQVYQLSGNNWQPISNPPPEVFGGSSNDRGLAGMLAQTALDAGKLDDLKKRLELKEKQPLGEMPAKILLFTLALKANDDAKALEMLKALGERAGKDTSAATLDTVSKLCQTALERPALESTASTILQKVATNYAITKNFAAATELGEKIIGHHIRKGNKAAAIGLLKTMETLAKTFITPDANFYERLGQWYLKAGSAEDALKNYGTAADMASTSGADASRRAWRSEPTLSGFVNLVWYLKEMPADKRYTVLKNWTFPSEKRKVVRYYVGPMPVEIPPSSFVKLPQIIPNELTSTMLLLADAAKECGKIDELLAEVDKVAKDSVENADTLRVLVYLRAGKGATIAKDITAFADAAVKRLKTKTNSDEAVRSRYDRGNQGAIPFHSSEFLFTQLCLQEPTLLAESRKLFQPMMDQAYATQNVSGIGRVRDTWARFANVEMKAPNAVLNALPERWKSLSSKAQWFAADGLISNAWTHEHGHLLFDTPLAGSFEFSADVYLATWKESHLGYAGIVYEANNDTAPIRVYPVSREGTDVLYRPKPKVLQWDNFNRVTIQVTPTKVTCLFNGELYYEDTDPSATSPWLMLFGSNGRKPVFRNPTLTGKPEVLAEVKLTNGDDLHGWFPQFTGGSMANKLQLRERAKNDGKVRNRYGEEEEQAEQKQEPNYDWKAKDGELLGRKLEDPTPTPQQAKLAYFRPLGIGETIRYEFFHEPGQYHVHPSLGRLAFLLETDGVKQHWITQGDDWSDLRGDNAMPLEGSTKPTLKAKDWNSASIAATADGVKIAINGAPVYEGKLDASIERTFGFFHYRDKTAVRVRNVVLTGNWPKKLGSLDDVNFTTKAPSPEVAKARRHEVGEKYFAGNPGEILKKVRTLPPSERYRQLLDWVLPGPTQPGFQLSGTTAPQDVLGIVDAKKQPDGRRVTLGGKFEAPCVFLVQSAKETNKLDELLDRVMKANSADKNESFLRNQRTMIALVRIAQGNDSEATAILTESIAAAKAMKTDEKAENRWADLVLATAALERPALVKLARDLAEAFNENWRRSFNENKPWDGRDVWGRMYASTRSRAAILANPDGSAHYGRDDQFANWIAVNGYDSWSRSQGWDAPHWSLREKTFVHQPGHRDDYLMLKTPIRGDFEVSCELRVYGWAEAQIRYGGYSFFLNHDRKWYKMHSTIRNEGRQTTILPTLEEIKNNRYAFKMIVKDGMMTAFVNGRKLHDERIGTVVDPWLCISAGHQCTSEIFNLKLETSKASVPEKIDLLAGEGLPMWRAYLGSIWGKRGEEIFEVGARPEPTPDGKPEVRTFPENAIYYQRPMIEDGSVEYEFYYSADKAMVYPMLDRLTVILEPDGAKLHWLTDSWHDKSDVKFDNLTPQGKPVPVPLKEKQWNEAKLSVTGDTLSVTVNGTLVFERKIEATNQRTFGLFHYSDRTEARVRNAFLSGSWSKTVPTTEQLFEMKK